MIAALPMYDWPELRGATDGLWSALRARLIAAGFDAPAALERAAPEAEIWSAPDLLLAQTCGMPYATGAARAARLVAAPVYAVEGGGATCRSPPARATYRSALVARRGAGPLAAFRGARFAANGPDSLSGWAAPVAHLGADFIGPVTWSGGHRASIRAVAAQKADFAAIDAMCWDLARRFEPAAADLEVIGWTDAAPSTPFVTSSRHDFDQRAALRAALAATLADPALAKIRAALKLVDAVPVSDADYDPVRRIAATARAAPR